MTKERFADIAQNAGHQPSIVVIASETGNGHEDRSGSESSQHIKEVFPVSSNQGPINDEFEAVRDGRVKGYSTKRPTTMQATAPGERRMYFNT